jgi:hypothetical protein
MLVITILVILFVSLVDTSGVKLDKRLDRLLYVQEEDDLDYSNPSYQDDDEEDDDDEDVFKDARKPTSQSKRPAKSPEYEEAFGEVYSGEGENASEDDVIRTLREIYKEEGSRK